MIYFLYMKRALSRRILLIVLPLAAWIGMAAASASAGLKPEAHGQTCMSDCSQCHELTNREAAEVLKSVNAEIDVIGVREAPVNGLWEVAFRARGKKSIAYVDIAGKHIMTGSIIYARTGMNLTKARIYDINKVDVSAVPLDDALIFGNPQALYKVIVFVDPDDEYSYRLHREMRKIVEERDDVAFLLKLYPIIKVNPSAYAKSKTIVCERSVRLLERAYEGRTLPAAGCDTNVVDETIELAERMGIESTPTYILPDGGIDSGPKEAGILLDTILAAGAFLMSPDGGDITDDASIANTVNATDGAPVSNIPSRLGGFR